MEVIIKPILTEKMTIQGEKLNRYGFIVDIRANKLQIRNAVEQMYNVTVTDVNTINYMGKQKSRYTKAGLLVGRTNNFKKAIVTLKEGDKIKVLFKSHLLLGNRGLIKLKTTNGIYSGTQDKPVVLGNTLMSKECPIVKGPERSADRKSSCRERV